MTDFEDDELDIELRDPDDIGARIILLTSLSVWPQITERAERNSWQRWLDTQGVLAVGTALERDILDGPVQNQTAADICERAVDSIPALAWATALLEETPLIGTNAERDELVDRIPGPDERIEPFLDQLMLRDEDAVAVERERAEIWNWRLASEAIRRVSRGINRDEIDEAIREVVLESAISFAISEIDTNDFLVDGVPVHALDDERLDALIVTSEERLRAFNWLCGLTNWGSIHPPD